MNDVILFQINTNTELEKCKPKKKILSRDSFYHFDGKEIRIVVATIKGKD